MQRILRILLLTCCVLGDTTGIQPALELCRCWDRALCQQTLQPCCLEKTVLPRYCCWIYAVRNLGWLKCFLACQKCPLLVYKSVVDGESELSFSQIFMADVLYSLSCLSTQTLFSILFCSAIRLRALASDRAEERKDWIFFFKLCITEQ